ncbi:MaoC family dehydratase [Sphingosinicella rhizophila]|uniref:MaoC family dehydratase n=1 Tax=Sphingosinicella rhizophila TaxID=3050082 RepID=A0ABU3QBD4_9SPHN|nr:MaoC family dehydratase [Sphingosinicella sp. GR2756]MDT9600720.1 MaoC family dehydratase [Sphingosinicella sp. GR2756]
MTAIMPGDNIAAMASEEEARTSAWVEITQDMIDRFGAATLDLDPMHVDPEWAKAGPFGTTIAFGFLTAGLLTHLLHDALGDGPVTDPDRTGYYLNYGFDRMRLVAPVPVGARVRGHFKLLGRTSDSKGRQIARFDCVIEIENGERPALVAEWLSMWVPPRQ